MTDERTGEPEAPPPPPLPGEAAPGPWQSYTPPPAAPQPTKRSRWPRILGIALVVAVVVGGVAVQRILFGRDAYEQALADATASLMESADFKSRYGTVSDDEAEQIGTELGAKGIGHLGDAELEEYFGTTVRIVETLDEEPCAQLLAGSVDNDAVLEGAKTLEIDTFRRYIDILMAGARAELEGAAPPPAPTDAELQAAFVALAAELGQDRALEVLTIVSDPSSHEAGETCAATLEMLRAILDVPDAERRDLLRFMASQAAPS